MLHFSDFVRRDDLCKGEQSRVLYCSGVGTLVKNKQGWYASNDTRLELIGVVPNAELCRPTLGPFKTAKDAFAAYANRADYTATQKAMLWAARGGRGAPPPLWKP